MTTTPKRRRSTKKKEQVENIEVVEVSTEPTEPTVMQDDMQDAPIIIEIQEEVESVTKDIIKQEGITLTVERDEEGRIVVILPNKAKRIAGDDTSFPEVLRQVGIHILQGKLI